MKKGLFFLAAILVVAMVMSIMVPAFAKDEMDCVIFSPQASDIGIGWGAQNGQNKGLFIGSNVNGAFDEETGAVKFEGTGSNMYLQVWSIEDDTYKVDGTKYPYMAFSYKVLGCEDTCMVLIGEGTAADKACGEVTEFTRKIGDTPMEGIDKSGTTVNIKVVDYHTKTVVGVTAYLQYVGFFKSEADARAFDYTEWIKRVPDYITPQPDVVEPGTVIQEALPPYHVDNKYPAVTGQVTIIGEAVVLLCASAAVMMVFGKKK